MTAKVNLKTGKIIECKQGSFAWWHEKGHIVYDNLDMGIRNGYLQEMWLYITITMGIFAILFKTLWVLAFIGICFFWYYFFFEEIWCDDYAKLNLKKGGKKCSRKNYNRKKQR